MQVKGMDVMYQYHRGCDVFDHPVLSKWHRSFTRCRGVLHATADLSSSRLVGKRPVRIYVEKSVPSPACIGWKQSVFKLLERRTVEDALPPATTRLTQQNVVSK